MITSRSKVVYTAIFGNYDNLADVNPNWDCDFVCFTNNSSIISAGWQVVIVPLDADSESQANRRYKMLPHKYLQNYEWSLYVDGNIRLMNDPSSLFYKYLNNGSIAIPKHQDRNCLYKEALVCIESGHASKYLTEQQVAIYMKQGFPQEYGMTENNIILRRHNDLNVIALMESWWREYSDWGKRDQLSLSYLIWKYEIEVLELLESPRISEDFFRIELHLTDKSKNILRRWARQIAIKKNINLYFFTLSIFVDFFITMRNKFLIKNPKQ